MKIEKSLELAIASLERELGKGTVFRLGSQDLEAWPAIPTGAFTLDLALGIGGLPRGRIVEIIGQEGVGKSTLSLSVIAEAQKMGLTCLFVDSEHALDPNYAKTIGVNLDELWISQPDHGEGALIAVNRMVSTGDIGVVVVDSVAGLTPKAELDGEIGDAHIGQLPRLMSQSMRMLAGIVAKTNTLVIFTNQLREKIGTYVPTEVAPGGRALKYQASVRLDLRRKEDVKGKEDGTKIGIKVSARIIKNKMAPPYVEAEYDILYGKGINQIGCVFDVAVKRGVFEKSSSWFNFEGNTFAQGRDNAIEMLASDLDLFDKVKGKINDLR